MAISVKNLPDEELIYGQKSCQGCGALIAGRLAMKVLGKNTVLVTTACCFGATSGAFPENSFFVNNICTAFPGMAATMTGMVAAKRALGMPEDLTLLGVAGDGGTYDIGFQAVSGAAERNEDILYICYDNEAYMNTGVQRSAATPYGASTTTTPAGRVSKGCQNTFKKPIFEIISAHRVPYVATASTSYPMDFMKKVEKAKGIRGFRMIIIQAPCPTGWGHEPEDTIRIGKMAVESGLWYLAECEDGAYRLNLDPGECKPVDAYMKAQKRFRHLNEEDYRQIEAYRDASWERLRRLFRE